MYAMFEALGQSPVMALLFTGMFGLLVGSFLNVVIYRVPKMMELAWAAEAAELRGEAALAQPVFNLISPRSRCPHCGHQIRAWENIPILSWLFLRGKCSACSARISARYPIIEAVTAGLSAAAVAFFGFNTIGLAAVVFSMILLTLAMIDVDTQLLPDSINLPLLWLGLGANLFGLFAPLRDAVIGAMFGYLLLWSVYWLFKLATGKEGMGYGDFKLLAALGAWFGWQSIPAIILLSSIVGAVIGIALIILAKRGREVPMPFGPYLAGAGLLMLYLREPINSLLLRI
jgi:leader peptidase (prepilin peptidase) / N-methyltransferase